MKTYLISLVIKKMQIKPQRESTINLDCLRFKKIDHFKCWKECEATGPSYTVSVDVKITQLWRII